MVRVKEHRLYIKGAVIWVSVVLFSIVAILVGNHIVTRDFSLFNESGEEAAKGQVIDILDRLSVESPFGETESPINTIIRLTCKIKNGLYKDQVVGVQQSIDSIYSGSELIKEVEPGDSIMLFKTDSSDPSITARQLRDYYRFDKVMILGMIFAGLVLLIGRGKGTNTLLSLAFTFLFVFLAFVPSVMNGLNAYIGAAITCFYTIVMTLVLINGISKEALAIVIGCVSGIILASIATSITSKILLLTGFVDEHSVYLIFFNPGKPVDLTVIIFAAIIIGAMGAIMGVAMDISSSLFGLHEHAPNITSQKLLKSGMRIGRDIMSTMADTLVLAYIGSSLSSIILLLTHSNLITYLLNREVIIVEFLQALIGSLAIIFTIPFTVFTYGPIYLRRKEENS